MAQVPVSKTVLTTTGGITLSGVVLTVITVIQALRGNPTNAGGIVSGNLLAVVGLVGTIAHFHKGVTVMSTQNDIENVVGRIRSAWGTLKSSGGLQRAEVDLSSAVKLAEELEAEVEKLTGTTPQTSTDTPADTSAPAPAPGGSDFSKLAP